MKKVTSLLLALVMCVSLCLPVSAAWGAGRVPPAPYGYTYLTSNRGNTLIDAAFHAGAVTISGAVIGGPAWAVWTVVTITIADLTGSTLAQLEQDDSMTGYYTEFIYECDDPAIYPYIYYHYIVYFSDAERQHKIGDNSYYEYALLPR